ncbi:MAG: hypothetical protein ACRD2X_22965 [Vicinamibacteraceae bacterium]
MIEDLRARRQFFAEEIAAVANLRTPGLVEALAALAREKFLRPGPGRCAARRTSLRRSGNRRGVDRCIGVEAW